MVGRPGPPRLPRASGDADPSGVADQLSAEAWTDLDSLTSSSVRPVATQPGSSGLQAE